MTIIIPGRPITKKNSQRILRGKNGARFIKPSAQYEAYEQMAGWYIKRPDKAIRSPVNVQCVYYMPTRHRVDLCNLLEATCDILTHYGVLEDDHSGIVCSHDGSRVDYDRENPRVEIQICEVKA